MKSTPSHHCFTIDVQDCFPTIKANRLRYETDNSDEFERKTIQALNNILDLLCKYEIKATIFFLGSIAERHPNLVRRAAFEGHEIASHGYFHKSIKNVVNTFKSDISNVKSILEDITGFQINGYRSPAFTLNEDTIHAYEILADAGYKYSSSVSQNNHSKSKHTALGNQPVLIETRNGQILEIPITSFPTSLSLLNCFGGKDFLSFPFIWHRAACKLIQNTNRHFVFHISPAKLNLDKAALKPDILKNFRSNYNSKRAYIKIEKMLQLYKFVKMEDIYSKYKPIRTQSGITIHPYERITI